MSRLVGWLLGALRSLLPTSGKIQQFMPWLGPGLEDEQMEPPHLSEAEWLACSNPTPMLRFLIGTDQPRVQDIEAFPACKGSDRKLRLFACACYRRIRHLLPDPRALAAVETAERVADGLASLEDLARAEADVWGPLGAMEEHWRASRGAERTALAPTHEALALALQTVWREAPKAAWYAASNASHASGWITDPESGAGEVVEKRVQADLLRCVFGHLCHPASLASEALAANDGAAAKIAHAVYEDRAWDGLPILADALEDAGVEGEIIAHLRDPSPHARGCWAVDAVLRRE